MKSDIEINYLAIKLRKQYGEDESSYIDIFDFAKRIKDLTVVFYPLGLNISGMCIKQDQANVIAINSNTSLGRQRFSLAHELYHLFFDSTSGTSISNLETSYTNSIEDEANTFASFFLVTYNTLADKLSKINKINNTDILALENSFGLSHLAMLYRLKKYGYINDAQYKEFSEINIIETAKYYFSDTDLYTVSNGLLKKTFGNYIKQAKQLKQKGIISQGAYNEFLLDAFRDDLVYQKQNEVIDGWFVFFWYRLLI